MTEAIWTFQPGWIEDKNYCADQIAERASLGQIVSGAAFSANTPQLEGTWARMKAAGCTGVFLRDREVKLLGKHRRPMFQKFGTCVSRGSYRGVQTSLDYSIVENLSLQRPVTLSFAPIYSLARVEVGKNRCGSGDGAILGDAMRAIHDYGVATDALFANSTEDDTERMAVKYAAPGQRTPASWIAACKGHTCVTFVPETLSLLVDCIAAGYAAPYACGYITAMPDVKGLSRLGSAGGHCRCFVGVYLDENGDEQLESSESWQIFPAAPIDAKYDSYDVEKLPCITIHYAGGARKLAPGDVGVDSRQFWQAIQSGGEIWSVTGSSYDAESLADASI